ncbi:hypothetical protein B0H14DRAFT_3491525 [Mycena olivaceomarginata]|nr:hypothetical protein B0H14DRAFT_3491525 [Mycena olivaceomarginata]
MLSGYPANGQDLNFFNMSGNEMAFDNFSGYGSYQQPTQSQGMHGVSFRQPLGSIPVNESAANRDTVVAQGPQLAQLQEILDKVLTRVAVLERELDKTKKAQELTQSALHKILEAEEEERKRKKQKTYQAGETKNKIQKLAKTLPHPLQPGESAGMLPGLGVPRAHPVWGEGLQNPTNNEFIEHVVMVAYERVLGDAKSTEPKYGKRHGKINTAEGKEKNDARAAKVRKAARTRVKAAELHAAVDELKLVHGEDATVGAEKLTDYVSSELSEPGDPEKGKAKGFATHKKTWPSNQLRLYYAYLRTLSRRKALRDAEAPGKKQSTLPPTKCGRVPYEWMVDPVWKARVEANIDTVSNPAAFTIFTLPIKMEDLDAEEREYLADYESS